MRIFITIVFLVIGFANSVIGQCFLTGADLSYTNEILKNGGVYKNENGEEVDPFQYFAFRETKMVRLRLWHTPSSHIDYCGNTITSSNLEDVLDAAIKVKSNGMKLKLSIHYSDYFSDPSKQKMPTAWEGLAHLELLDSIENYTLQIVNAFYEQDVLPDIISIGNETTWGFIDETPTTNGFNWDEDGDKFNAALNAIDSFNQLHNTAIKKAVHFTESTAIWATNLFVENGVDNFDLIGISYYPFFSPTTSISQLGQIINDLHSDHGKEVMVFETGFVWTENSSDDYNNFIANNGNTLSFPMSPQGQKEYLLELSQTIEQNNGIGLIYWEPSWITSELCDKWGQGSSYENVSMFDTENNQALESFEFFEYCGTPISSKEELSTQVSVFPNPMVSNEIIIRNVSSDQKWELLDLTGKIIMQGKLNKKETNSIIVSNKLRGTYFLSLQSNEGSKNIIRKLIILGR